ncbi:hypothetical protein CANCADRAFT_143299 [Tortispora caseinolytica NRRL Y-17796]|uniref:sterol 14alpha-demethylase n=1 Tax=Tortispora caseinolytica NRRL Y-17796 TaxID=767744 RepID=A0A1E4TDG4_9ASCO|nr:hypothetical protein CANCADRAFT_143299 [Tortispora caseinolytica NRRL Y-17796]
MGVLSSINLPEPVVAVADYVTALPLGIKIPVLFFGFLFVVVLLNVLNQLLFPKKNEPPMVFHWFPIIGNAVTYGMEPYKFFDYCREKYGDVFTFVMLGKKMVVYLGPSGNDFIFNAKHADACAEEAYKHLTTPVFGEGVIFDCPNERLMEQKKFAKAALTREAFQRYVPIITKEFNDYMLSSPTMLGGDKSKQTGVTPLMQAMPELTIFTASHCLQGEEVRSQFDTSFAQLYTDLDHGFTPLNFVFPHLPLPSYRKRDEAQRKISRLYQDIIEKRRKNNDIQDRDLIDALMKNGTYRDGVKMTDKEIANLNIGILMGGQHTSSSTLSWMFLHLGAQPELQDKLYEELCNAVGGDPNEIPLTYEHLANMPLHAYTVRETLRTHSPLHTIMRKVMRPMFTPDKKYVIPAGHYLLAAPGVPMRDSRYFADPEKFDPYRWDVTKYSSDGSGDEKIDYGYGLVSKGANSPYLPFGAGRHRCIGEQFAYVQISTVIANMVRCFKWTLPEGQFAVPEPDYSSMIALPPPPATIQWVRRM